MADWVKVGGNETTTFYADLNSIRIEESGVRMWSLLDLKIPDLKIPDSSIPTPYLSMKSRTEYNCNDVTYRFLDSQNYSSNMGEGDLVLRNTIVGEWVPVPQKSAVKTLWNIACGNTPF